MSPATRLPLPVKQALQVGTVTYGRATAPLRLTPTLLQVGAQRSGTTSMYRALAQHPALCKPVLHKGVHYFDTDYHRGAAWYRGHFAVRPVAQRAAARLGVEPVAFESSPYYMCHPLAPGRIARDLPGVRLLVLLRDPVERAYSAHSHELARGYETLPFEAALDAEPDRLAGEDERLAADGAARSHSHQHHAYVARGEYVTYLERLEALVGRERLHVVDSSEFFTAPEEVFAGVLRFLRLPEHPGVRFEQHNARHRSSLPAHLRTRLEEHFGPWDERLATWWGRQPSWHR